MDHLSQKPQDPRSQSTCLVGLLAGMLTMSWLICLISALLVPPTNGDNPAQPAIPPDWSPPLVLYFAVALWAILLGTTIFSVIQRWSIKRMRALLTLIILLGLLMTVLPAVGGRFR
ncbi:MAG: hypothetical protein KatS3mg057_0090 [Herpetosiphonaceae bacterium]|nr:MAG: hypothetical protein KatS3mg057_0090 [Herpetosiphonaceae bacterium]